MTLTLCLVANHCRRQDDLAVELELIGERTKALAAKCDHDSSRLTCIDCANPICSACLVQCPVGFRCQKCVGGTAKVNVKGIQTSMLVPKSVGASALVGFAGGWILPFVSIPYVSCIIMYFLGSFAGRWLAQKLDYHQLGGRVSKVVTWGLLLGMVLTPCGLIPMFAVNTLIGSVSGQQFDLIAGLMAVVNLIFCPVCFIVGVLRPTIWGERF